MEISMRATVLPICRGKQVTKGIAPGRRGAIRPCLSNHLWNCGVVLKALDLNPVNLL